MSSYKYNICEIDNLTDSHLLELRQSKIVVFVGSFISVYSPTSLTNGSSFCSKMFEYLFNESYSEDKFICQIFRDIPFEGLLEISPNSSSVQNAITKYYLKTKPNLLHKILAEQMKIGNIKSIVTTNYDLSFDSILHESCYKIISNPPNKVYSDYALYFKIHGSADIAESLVYKLSQEGTLNDWKKDFLLDIIADKIVLFVGYSGRDFDICPFIAESKRYKKIYWLHFCNDIKEPTESLSEYAKLLLQSNPENMLIIGGLPQLLSAIYKKDIEVSIKESEFEFHPNKLFDLPIEDICRWKLNIIDRLGYGQLGLSVLDKDHHRISEVEFLSYKSKFLAHQGKYKAGITFAFQAITKLESSSKEYVEGLIAYTNMLISYGSYLKAYRNICLLRQMLKKEFENDKSLEASMCRIELTFFSRMYDWSKLLPISQKLQQFIRKRGFSLLDHAFDTLIPLGYWDDRQTLQFHIERFGYYRSLSLPSHFGFRNLGLFAMDIVKYKDLIRKSTDKDRSEYITKIDDYISKSKSLLFCPEIWKLSRLKLKYSTSLTLEEKKMALIDWKINLLETEYPVLLRSFLLLQYHFNFLKVRYNLIFSER